MRFHFLAERMKIGKVKTLITNLRDKERYVEHIQNLSQALKMVNRVIRSEQRYRMKSYIMLNNKLRINAKVQTKYKKIQTGTTCKKIPL